MKNLLIFLLFAGLFLTSCENPKKAKAAEIQASDMTPVQIEETEKLTIEMDESIKEINKTSNELDALLKEIDD